MNSRIPEYQFEPRLKVYGFQELAVLYFPDIQPGSASRQLKRCINDDRELLGALHAAGYRNKRRTFTPRQVRIIFHFLGTPETEGRVR